MNEEHFSVSSLKRCFFRLFVDKKGYKKDTKRQKDTLGNDATIEAASFDR